jgi:predicted amidohydrolase YtcJ
MDPARPEATALLVRDGRIEQAGDEADLRAAAPGAERVDLGGRFVCPGFIDAHNHFSLTALEPVSIDCRTPPVRSIDDLLTRVHEAAGTALPGQWLRGHGYDDGALGRHPTRADLDAAAPDNPVVLMHWTVHRCVANSAALRAVGLDAAAADPAGGWIVRDAAGDATGLLYERAADPVQAVSIVAYAEAYREELPALFRLNAQRHLVHGITALGDAYVHPALHPVYDDAALLLTVRRFCGSRRGLFAPPEECIATAGEGVKIFVDGGGNTTAASLASGRPPRFLFYTQPELDALVAAAHGAGLPIAVHAAGDIAVTMALDAFAQARRVHPDAPPRFRIEHAITVKEQDIPRLRDLDVAVVTQPSAVFHAGARLAAAPLAEGVRIAPWRDLLDAGVTLAFSSDSPCYELPPLFQMWCAVTRATGRDAALDDGQAVTPVDALAASTRAGAAALFDDAGGVLAAGRRADFVVLSADPLRSAFATWRHLRVVRTYVGGRAAESPPGNPAPDWPPDS